MLTQAVQTEISTVYALNDEFQRQKTIGKPLTIASKSGEYGTSNGKLDDKLKERYAEIVHLSEVPALEKGLTDSNDAYFYSYIDKNGSVMWTVYDNGNGYIGIYCGDDGKIDSFKRSEVRYADAIKMFMRDMLSIAIVKMHSTMELTYMQKISFMKIH